MSTAEIDRMYALYSASYCDAQRDLFRQDLNDKSHCIILRDADHVIQGFSTLKLYDSEWNGTPLRVIFSGDTIIDPAHWGSQQLAFAWIRFAGELQRQNLDVPLYWFLICKGHRTYRYLRAFARDYAPRSDLSVSPDRQALMDHLATQRFGAAYDSATGVLSFEKPQGRLTPELAQIPDAHLRLPDVAYFLQRNPHYARGDELVCLCELSPANLRPMARRLFGGEAG
ncbi:hypothetical protein LFL96_00110 [Paraburkholderia sp. D15]|uniref:hypothetical protein n=1 Tax=Paraburkholderia sp. D15 TaxID=2880218 RepID=UPI00247ABCCD|nr:hypothetical protein [Paraburkholderia sp. D15]WGS49956.1 hypothetical protein LFL96_00110 [Paraburkholderia sp. D15]